MVRSVFHAGMGYSLSSLAGCTCRPGHLALLAGGMLLILNLAPRPSTCLSLSLSSYPPPPSHFTVYSEFYLFTNPFFSSLHNIQILEFLWHVSLCPLVSLRDWSFISLDFLLLQITCLNALSIFLFSSPPKPATDVSSSLCLLLFLFFPLNQGCHLLTSCILLTV